MVRFDPQVEAVDPPEEGPPQPEPVQEEPPHEHRVAPDPAAAAEANGAVAVALFRTGSAWGAPEWVPGPLGGALWRPCFTKDYFQRLRDSDEFPQTAVRRHNVALKFLRSRGEDNNLECVDIDNFEPIMVPHCNHPPGTAFSFEGPGITPWWWQEMVAQLDNASLDHILGECRSRGGIVCCGLVRTMVYDHKRHKAGQIPPGEMGKIWDFVLVRSDRSAIFIHPDYTTTRVQCYHAHDRHFVPDHEIPASGKGGTSGKGTFRYFKDKHVDSVLTFLPYGNRGRQ